MEVLIFDVSGQMDLSNDAHLLTLTGKAGGWQLDDILHNLNFKKGASGTIYADFSVTGGTDSPKHFANSMNGNATVSMRDGSIETQLFGSGRARGCYLGCLPKRSKRLLQSFVCVRRLVSQMEVFRRNKPHWRQTMSKLSSLAVLMWRARFWT